MRISILEGRWSPSGLPVLRIANEAHSGRQVGVQELDAGGRLGGPSEQGGASRAGGTIGRLRPRPILAGQRCIDGAPNIHSVPRNGPRRGVSQGPAREAAHLVTQERVAATVLPCIGRRTLLVVALPR